MDILHTVTQFVAATLCALGAIYLVYLYYRQHMPGGLATSSNDKNRLKIEQTQYLEPKKAVHIIRSGQERFLVASTDQGLQLLSALQPLSDADLAAEQAAEEEALSKQFSPTDGNFRHRFAMSLRMTVMDRLGIKQGAR